MFEFLRPCLAVDRVEDICLEELKSRGIKGIVLDLDNTLTEWNENAIGQPALSWVLAAKEDGFGVCITSNTRSTRAEEIAGRLGLVALSRAGKPRRTAFVQAMKLMGTTASQTAVVGDQIFTDVLGGNRLGLYTVLVRPLSGREFLGTKFMRILERFVFWYFRLKRG